MVRGVWKLGLTVDVSSETSLPLEAPRVAALWGGWLPPSKPVLFLLSEGNQTKRGVPTWEAVPTLTVISSEITAQWHRGHPQPNLVFFLFFCREDFLIPEISPTAKRYVRITWSAVLIALGNQNPTNTDLLLKHGLRKSCSVLQTPQSIPSINIYTVHNIMMCRYSL